MLQHNLTIAFRNLTKYKLQTTISVLSLAIGIVTLSLVHSIMQEYRPANIHDMPYYDRVYELYIESKDPARPNEVGFMRYDDVMKTVKHIARIQNDILQALKQDGGMSCVGTDIYISNETQGRGRFTFRLSNGAERKSMIWHVPLDPTFPRFWGYRSAITGKLVEVLKPGEALISESQAKEIFGDENPIGATASVELWWSGERRTMTIVDVVEQMPFNIAAPNPNYLMYALPDWEPMVGYDIFCRSVFVILKPGATAAELEREANERLQPLNVVVHVVNTKEYEQNHNNSLDLLRIFSYAIGTLILLVAIIGFLRMQVQLFWMRRREVSLRIVHGAHFRQLLVQLLTEVSVAVLLAVALAIPMGWWLEDFASYYLQDYINDGIIRVQQLGVYSLTVGAVVLLLCAFVVWLTLRRICRSVRNLAEGLRGTRSHLFRNVMLCVQITLCLVFVCGTLVMTQWAAVIQDSFCLPDDEAALRRTARVKYSHGEQPIPLRDALMQLPDVETAVPVSSCHEQLAQLNSIPGIEQQPGFAEGFIMNDKPTFYTYLTTDTAFLRLYEMNVKWLPRNVDRTRCILVQEDLFRLLNEHGVAQSGGELSICLIGNFTYPIAGTFDKVLFRKRDAEGQRALVVIDPDLLNHPIDELMLQAKEGRYEAMMRDIDATIQRLEPSIVEKFVKNQMDYAMNDMELNIVMAMRHAGWLLSVVALLVCAMSVYSTIALDTRARRKEMAIRKINGAKRRDIARIFVRLYVLCLSLAIVVAVPLSYLFNNTVCTYIFSYRMEGLIAPSVLLPLAGGILLLALTVALIVGWQVHGIMRVNPADIIAKE